jgi:hypothetical protein
MSGEDESIGRVVYEDLVHLTFLCGRGLPLRDLMGRFLKAMAPRIPAEQLWLIDASGVVARRGEGEPPMVSLAWRGLTVDVVDGCLVASVQPDVVLACPAADTGQRARDVLSLFARMLGLAWQAESVATPESRIDDYAKAKAAFQRAWLQGLLERHERNVSESARACGLSRARLHQLIRELGLPSLGGDRV